MAKYLVTGGCGFIGSHLCELLLQEGHEVLVVDNLSTGKIENLPRDCSVVIGDILNPELVQKLFENIDGCFRLAAVASVQQSIEDWSGTHAINQSATINILNAAKAKKTPVVYASSAAVYGDNIDTPLTERSSCRPLTAYGADKLGSELHANVASLSFGVPTTGLRFFNVYGPRQDPKSPYSGVISIFSERISQCENISIFGDGSHTRDFVYVKDVARFLLQAMYSNNTQAKVFNVCTGKSVTIKQLASSIMSISGNYVPICFLPARNGDIHTSLGSPLLSQKSLHIRAEYTLHEGLKELIDYLKEEISMEFNTPYKTNEQNNHIH